MLADAVRVQQVLWNLLKNGIKVLATRGLRGSAHATLGERLVVEIVDGGIGIETRKLPQLFDAFEQGSLPDGHRNTGLGLGLALARSLTELHGGSLTAASAGTGRGATFRLTLPLALPDPASDAHPQRDAPRDRDA